jgi:hypothetical protein
MSLLDTVYSFIMWILMILVFCYGINSIKINLTQMRSEMSILKSALMLKGQISREEGM